ncbi:hypothetical protein CASFOL_012979 [Castilleja foliolosa]|uniref:ARGOS-like protein n=1 Tax=Castilleja foliolosa TaxID=1961234 RepID=A0ABD3DJX6_9LAMI
MNLEQPRSKSTFSNSIMDVRTLRNQNPRMMNSKFEYRRSLSSQGHGKKILFRYFTLESLFLLGCLTASLLILPLVLPPLPPPPLMLLLVPIFILALLMVLAFMPFGVRDVSNTYS